jgi:hypothetical protein
MTVAADVYGLGLLPHEFAGEDYDGLPLVNFRQRLATRNGVAVMQDAPLCRAQ